MKFPLIKKTRLEPIKVHKKTIKIEIVVIKIGFIFIHHFYYYIILVFYDL